MLWCAAEILPSVSTEVFIPSAAGNSAESLFGNWSQLKKAASSEVTLSPRAVCI